MSGKQSIWIVCWICFSLGKYRGHRSCVPNHNRQFSERKLAVLAFDYRKLHILSCSVTAAQLPFLNCQVPNKVSAAECFLSCTSGSVKGTLLSDKIFLTDSGSGSIRVPRSTEGGTCEITTTSGSIRIDIAK